MPSGVPVLTYHALVADAAAAPTSDSAAAFYFVSAPEFERQLDYLREQRFETVLAESIAAGAPPNGKSVGITFDDGFRSDLDLAIPALAKRGFRATFFVVLEFIGRRGYMSWDDLRAIVAAGSSVQCHGFRHVDMTSVPPAELTTELTKARMQLEEKLGSGVYALAFPYGRWNAAAAHAANNAGFRVLLTSEQRLATPGQTRLARLAVHSRTSLDTFQRMAQRDPKLLLKTRLSYTGIEGAKSLLGKSGYERVKRMLFGRGGE
jgi:peptidoglycan/xylan/chitin deacetylase (PgdA/CDA1 family)